MAASLRICLILGSLATFYFMIGQIRNAKVRIEDSLFWLCFAILLLLLSIFPQPFYWASNLVGTMAPVNFVFLFFIFILLIRTFKLNIRVSQNDTKIKNITQQLAIEKFERWQGMQGAGAVGAQAAQDSKSAKAE